MDVRTYPFRRNGKRACAHASARRSSVNAALAGLVEGHLTASRPVCSRQYFMYSPWAVLPLVMIWRMDAVLRILFKSMGTTLRILWSALDITGPYHIPERDAPQEQDALPGFIVRRERFLQKAFHQLPEPVLGMAVVKILFPRSDGRETSKNQYPGVPVIDRLQGMDDPGITGKQACFKTVFFM